MSSTVPNTNGLIQHWLIGRTEPSGQFTAQVVGVPELQATAPTREKALEQVRSMVTEWISQGRLISIDVPAQNPLLNYAGHLDPNDPLEQEFQKELVRLRREDMMNALRENGQECSDSSSIPTT